VAVLKVKTGLHEFVCGSAAVILYLSSVVSAFAEISFRSSSTAQTTTKQCGKLHGKWNLSFCSSDFRAEIQLSGSRKLSFQSNV